MYNVQVEDENKFTFGMSLDRDSVSHVHLPS